mgnify:CR=1 FL=1
MAGDVTLRQMEAFAALEEHPTMAAAAKALHLSESALSHSISTLEHALGQQLCIRRRAHGVTLTPSGRAFARQAREILRSTASLVAEASSHGDTLQGPIALGCYAGLASNILPVVIETMTREHPGITISLTVGDNGELLEGMHDGRLDLAFLYDIALPSGLELRPLYPTQVMAVLAADHPLAQRPEEEGIPLKDLADQPLIALNTSPSTGNTALMFEQQGIEPVRGPLVPHSDLVRALVARGLGYSLLMSRPHQIHQSSEGLPLATRPLEPRAGITNVVAAWPEAMRMHQRGLTLVDLTSRVLQDENYS